MNDAPPHDHEAEAAVLGVSLIAPATLDKLTGPDHALRPEHFDRPDHARLFTAMLGLRDRGEPVDTITVKAECQKLGWEAGTLVEVVSSGIPDMGNWETYARSIKRLAFRRRILEAARLLEEAAWTDKTTLIGEAERLLEDHESTSSAYTPEKQAEDVFADNMAPVICKWPWTQLNGITHGGMRAGQTTFISGWTNHGKSPLMDSVLLGARSEGLKVALYINEMGEAERAMRFAAQLQSDVGFETILEGMDASERAHVAAALADGSIPILNAAAWTAADVCRDIKRSGWDVVGVDGLHMFEYDNESQLSGMAVELAQCAKQSMAHILIAGHLNEKRAETGELPPPVLRDIRGSGHIKNAMDFVIFLHRAQTEDGFPLEESRIWVAKGRNSGLGGFRARYNSDRMRFEAQ